MATESTSRKQTYYLPAQSRLPIIASLGLVIMMGGLASFLNARSAGAEGQPWLPVLGFAILTAAVFNWFRTVIREDRQGLYSAQLSRSFVWGMGWFIFSEVMFFFGFFLALFYARLFAVPWLAGEGDKAISNLLWPDFSGATWPPVDNPDSGLFPNPKESMAAGEALAKSGLAGLVAYIPLWNTIVLVSSSVTVHLAHVALKNVLRPRMIAWLGVTIVLGVSFVVLQSYEYHEAYSRMGLTLGSGIYGSTFFILTGFHGFHVTLGAFILGVMFLRALKGHFTREEHFGFQAASWYWHFVDGVWLVLFTFVYCL